MKTTGIIKRIIGPVVDVDFGGENQNLPAYVALPDPKGLPVDGIRNWSCGWLPPVYQGTAIRSDGMPVLHLQPKVARSADIDQGRLELLRRLNRRHQQAHPGELELDARISSFELAARMQLSATDALDVQHLRPPDQHRPPGQVVQAAGEGRRPLGFHNFLELEAYAASIGKTLP